MAMPSVNITAVAAAAADTQHAGVRWRFLNPAWAWLWAACWPVGLANWWWLCWPAGSGWWPVGLVGLVVALVQNKSAEKSCRCVYKNATSSPA